MFEIFAQLAGLLKRPSACIDNNVFTLHYKATVIILVVFSIVVGTSKYFGDPIDCTVTIGGIANVVDAYCWYRVFILVPRDPNGSDKAEVHSNVFHHFTDMEELKNHPTLKVKHLYIYQWFEFILFLQAVAFFIPRYLWRYCWEQGQIKALTENSALVHLKKDDDQKQRHTDIVSYFRRNKYGNWEYSLKFVVCELLNFANVLGQYIILCGVLNASWSQLFDDLTHSESNYDYKHPVHLVFPNLARCEIPAAGGSGSSMHSEYCALPIMVFVAKFYILLLFYFLFLTVVSGISLLFRFFLILSPHLRCFLLQRQAKSPDNLVNILRPHLDYGSWFLLYQVGKNMDPFLFKDLLYEYKDAVSVGRQSVSMISSVNSLYPGDMLRQVSKNSQLSEKENLDKRAK